MIINLTQHQATVEQREAGVVDLTGEELAKLKELLTFSELPDDREIRYKAERITEIATADLDIGEAMIGGALWLMAPLAAALRRYAITPLFAFSVRETEEQTQPDGSIRKVAVFRHAGFVRAI